MLRKILQLQQIKFFLGNSDAQTLSPSQNRIIFIAYLVPVALVIWFISKGKLRFFPSLLTEKKLRSKVGFMTEKVNSLSN